MRVLYTSYDVGNMTQGIVSKDDIVSIHHMSGFVYSKLDSTK